MGYASVHFQVSVLFGTDGVGELFSAGSLDRHHHCCRP